MTDKLLIEREMLEQVASEFEHDNDRYMLGRELRAILTAPRQPEGEGLEVVAFYWLDTGYENPNSHGPYFGWPNEDALRRVDGGAMPIALCRLSDAKRVIAELRQGCDTLRIVAGSVCGERDTLRQQLADSDAALRESRANDQAAMWHLADMRQQRDKLAGLLREAHSAGRSRRLTVDELYRIDAALAEVSR